MVIQLAVHRLAPSAPNVVLQLVTIGVQIAFRIGGRVPWSTGEESNDRRVQRKLDLKRWSTYPQLMKSERDSHLLLEIPLHSSSKMSGTCF